MCIITGSRKECVHWGPGDSAQWMGTSSPSFRFLSLLGLSGFKRRFLERSAVEYKVLGVAMMFLGFGLIFYFWLDFLFLVFLLCFYLFKIEIHIKLTIWKYSIRYINNVMQPSCLPSSKTFSPPQKETLCPLNSRFPFPQPLSLWIYSPWMFHISRVNMWPFVTVFFHLAWSFWSLP